MRQAALFALVSLVSTVARADEVAFHRFDLPNGIRVVLAQTPEAPQQITFTFLPMTIANDDQGRAQWSHLMEHMLIRSTDPNSLSVEGLEINGETTATYLRLDTYAKPDHWKQALERQAKWLTASEFDPAVLEREKGVIQIEEQSTAQGGHTTKFAMAAWNQAASHGLKHVAVHGDVAGARLPEVQMYAAGRVPHDRSVLIASIGPIDPQQMKAEIERLFGTIPKKEWSPPKAAQSEVPKSCTNMEATWDLPTRHAIWWWALPNQTPGTLGAATLMARSIQMQYRMKPKRDLRVRQLLAYPCVVTSRGAFFVIDACLAAPGDIPNLAPSVPLIKQGEVLADLQTLASALRPNEPGHQMFNWMISTMMQELPRKPDFKAMRQQLPAALRDKAEGVWLLSMMNYEYSGNVPANIALESIENTEPGSLNNLLEQLRGQPTGTLELEPATQAPTTAPAENPGQ